MRVLVCALLALSAVASLQAQLPRPVPPNYMLPPGEQIPRSKQAHWVASDGRTTESLSVPGAVLRGYRYAGSNPSMPTMLFFNGSGMSIEPNDDLFRKLAGAGPTVVVLDYRGVGFSSGTPDTLAFRTDALAVYDKLAADSPTHKLIVYGFSLGTAFAAYVASQRSVAALILAAPMATAMEEMRVMAADQGGSPSDIAQIRIDPDLTTMLDETGMVKKNTAPLLVLHGTNDKTIPFAQGKEVFDSGTPGKRYMAPIKGADHENLLLQPLTLAATKQFFALLSPKPAA